MKRINRVFIFSIFVITVLVLLTIFSMEGYSDDKSNSIIPTLNSTYLNVYYYMLVYLSSFFSFCVILKVKNIETKRKKERNQDDFF
jgi:hypothetical protein